MLRKAGEDQLDWPNEERSVTQGQEEVDYPKYDGKKEGDWLRHILRGNWLLQQAIGWKIEERIEVIGRQGRRLKPLLDDFEGGGGKEKKKETGNWKS